jgi:hypothetical protein
MFISKGSIYMVLIIILLVMIGFILLMEKSKREGFCTYLSIVDPYSLYLHDNIMPKAEWWNDSHRRKFYYYHDYVPQYYKE